MQRITIITLGKLKEKYLKEFSKKYTDLLKRYCKLEVIEIDSLKIKDNIDRILLEEEKKILKHIDGKNYFTIVLDELGKEFSSVDFSKKIENLINFENSSICIIIGSPHGLSQNIKKRANMKLALSKMTFTHDMARIFLLEQLYRAYKIMKNENYHK